MKKDRWCSHFKGGRCQIPVGDDQPSLSEIRSESLGEEVQEETITESLKIFCFLQAHNPDMLKEENFPKMINIRRHLPRLTNYYICKGSNCRNAQKKCSNYN